MDLNKKGLIIVGILVIILLSNIFNENITGNVIINSANEVNNCSDETIIDIWNEIFYESSDNIEIFKDSYIDGVCSSYSAIKTNENGEFWYLNIGNINFYGIDMLGMTTSYANITDDAMSDVSNIDNYNDINNFWLNLMADEASIQNWTIEDLTAAEEKFNDYFEIHNSEFEYNYELGSYNFIQNLEEGFITENITGGFSENKSFILLVYYYFNSTNDYLSSATLTSNISNYEFEINSSWNYAFDIDDYFDYNNVSFEFNYTDEDNSNGELINYSINDSGVYFKPTVGFNGSRKFNIWAYTSIEGGKEVYGESNIFNVTIGDINNAPIFIKSFESIGISANFSIEIILDDYFEDSDKDNLTYRVIGDENLTVNFINNTIIILSYENFTYTRLKIYASDGVSETKSNFFYVYNTKGPNIDVLIGSLNESLDMNISGDLLSGNITSGNESADAETGDENYFDWILWIFVSVIALILILFIIWFFILRRNKFKNSFEGGNLGGIPQSDLLNDPVKKYLDNLNLSK